MRDMGLVRNDEPVARLFTQGMVIKGGAKMSKNLGNVVSPDDMVGALRRRLDAHVHAVRRPSRSRPGLAGRRRRRHQPLPESCVSLRCAQCEAG